MPKSSRKQIPKKTLPKQQGKNRFQIEQQYPYPLSFTFSFSSICHIKDVLRHQLFTFTLSLVAFAPSFSVLLSLSVFEEVRHFFFHFSFSSTPPEPHLHGQLLCYMSVFVKVDVDENGCITLARCIADTVQNRSFGLFYRVFGNFDGSFFIIQLQKPVDYNSIIYNAENMENWIVKPVPMLGVRIASSRI